MAPSAGDRGRPAAIQFPNGNTAQVAWGGPRRTAPSLLGEIGLSDQRPVLVVAGGAGSLDASIELMLARQLERGAIPAAADAGAVVIDGGTSSGVMSILGRASAASDSTVVLVGVAPAGKVTFGGDDRPGAETRIQLEPNHTHFLLANSSEWGGETTLMFAAVATISRDRPAAVLVVGGGPGTLDEVAAAGALGLPVVALAGSGGAADLLAGGNDGPAVPDVDAARVASLTASTDVVTVELSGNPGQLARVLARLLQVDETLRDSWRKQSLVSAAARREQRAYRAEQTTLLILGVILTFLAVSSSVLDAAGLLDKDPLVSNGLRLSILLIPIGMGTIVAAAGRLRPGAHWLLLRGTSETLKREIYRYRARAGIYSREQTRRTPRETKLAMTVGSAMDALMRTDVNLLALDPSADRRATRIGRSRRPDPAEETTVAPEKLAPLTPDGYVNQRIDEQIRWYEASAARLSRESRTLQWLALLFGAAGTFLAAVGLQIWVAVTTALVAAYGTYRAAWQLETSLMLYNQAAASLSSIRLWWFGLSPVEQARQANVDKLVEGAERVMKSEQSGWVQEMQDAMTQLRFEPADGGRQPEVEQGGATTGGPGTTGGAAGQHRGGGEPGAEPAP
jgi:SLOG in TRPM, prokaryote/SMODS and SLOG-associating 2TM effector domain 1/Protein of unknown function (DUF4231)